MNLHTNVTPVHTSVICLFCIGHPIQKKQVHINKVVTILLTSSGLLLHCDNHVTTYHIIIHCGRYVHETVAWLKQPCNKVVWSCSYIKFLKCLNNLILKASIFIVGFNFYWIKGCGCHYHVACISLSQGCYNLVTSRYLCHKVVTTLSLPCWL